MEDRVVLASGAVVPAIMGTVFDDVNTDGRPSVGEGVANVSVQLYQDDGDGLFESGGIDALVGTQTTDDNGEYCFGDLDPNARFFVVRASQTVGGLELERFVSGAIDPGLASTVIDEFRTRQTATANPPAPSRVASVMTFQTETEVLGGERDLLASLAAGESDINIRVNPFGLEDVLLFDASAGDSGTLAVTWDGTDGDAESVGLGLNDRDLTSGGANTGIMLRAGRDRNESSLKIRLYEGSANNFSEVAVALPDTGGDADGFIYVPFTDFVGNVSPTDVDAIQMLIDAGQSGDGTIDVIGLTGPKVVNIGDTINADVWITKDNGVSSVVPGEPVTYVVVARNAGPADVTGARVTDTFPSNLQNVTYTSRVSGSATGNTAAGVGAIDDSLDMPVGSSVTYTVQGTVRDDATGTLINTARISSPPGVLDNNLANNVASDRDVIGRPIDLRTFKDDGVRTVEPGDQLTYTIVFSNLGPGTVTDALAEDLFPSNLDNVSYTAVGSTGTSGYTEAGQGDIRDLLTIPEGGRVTYTVSAMVSAEPGGTVVNRASIQVPTGFIDVTPENNIEIDTNLVNRAVADLTITKTDNQTNVVPGEQVTYTIVVSNEGPANAGRIQIFDEFPVELENTFFTSTSTGGVSGNSPAGSDSIDDLVSMDVGSTITYTVTGTVSSSATGTVANTATVTSPIPDPDENNNSATDVNTLLPEVDLRITKTNGISQVNPGDEVTYTIVVVNDGPSDAPGTVIVDDFPISFQNVSHTRTQGGQTVNGTGSINDTIDLSAGETVTYVVSGTVSADAAGSLNNTATVRAPRSVADVDPANNSATDSDIIVRADVDVAITKRSDRVDVIPGRPIRYQIVVSNIGQAHVAGAVVRDILPADIVDVTYESFASAGASGNTSVGTGDILDTVDLDIGSSIIYTVLGTVSSSAVGPITNTATVEVAGDLVPGNNTAIDLVVTDPHADLSITKSNGISEVKIGDQVTYTIVVRNDGPSDVADVVVGDTFPAALTNVSYTSVSFGGATGNLSGTGNINDVVALPVGSSVTYTATGTVSANVSGALTNTATVSAPADATEIDPNNNAATDTDTLTGVVVLGSEPTVIRRDSIVGGAGVIDDTDVFKITAHDSGKMIVNLHFVDQFGNLDLEITDRLGNSIAVSESNSDNEKIVIPVVSQEMYFVRVFGRDGDANLYDLEIENFPAPVPVVARIATASDTGMMNDDAITNDGNPRFLFNADLTDFHRMGIDILSPVDPEVDPLQIPTAPGVAVEVTITNSDTGDTVRGFASPVGNSTTLFEFTPVGLIGDSTFITDGEYFVNAAVRVNDGLQDTNGADPATGRTRLSDPFWLVVDQTPPTAANRPNLFRVSDSGMSDADNVTNQAAAAIGGRGEPGTKVRLLGNREGLGLAEIIGQGVVNPNGEWEITTEPLVDGIHHIRAEFEDMAGNISDLGEPLIIDVDTRAPNTPYLDLARAADTGMMNADNVTNDNTLTFSMTTEDPGQTQRLFQFNYKYRLFVRPDAASEGVTGEERLIYDSAVDGDIPIEELLDGLTNNQLLTRTIGELPDGVHNFKLEVEDRAGNISEDFLLTVTIDTQAPNATVEMIDSSDAGMLNNDDVTNKMQPAFVGSSEVGSKVNIFANGVLVGQGSVTSDASDGVPNDGMGLWEVTVEPLADGEYTITSQITDLAGNTSTSEGLQIWVDTVKPNIPYLDLVSDTGANSSDNVTNTATPTVTVTAGATLDGGSNEFPNEIKYRIYDRPGDGGGEVLLIDSYGALQDFTTDGFFVETLPMLAEGVHNLKVEIEDRAGNISDAFLLNIEIDNSLPDVSAELLTATDTGLFDNDNITGINAPTITGTGTVGDKVFVFANGVLVGEGTVGSDETDGIAGNGLGAWQVTIDPLDDGPYEITAHVEDDAGNFAKSDPFTIQIDTVEPNQPYVDLLTDSGVMSDDNVTNTNTPTIDLILNDTPDGGVNAFPNDVKYRLFDRPGDADGEVLISSSVGLIQDGRLELTLPLLAEGVHNFKLEVEDRAGNLSHPFLFELSVDTTAPIDSPISLLPSSDSGMSNNDNVTNKMEPAFRGVSSVGSKVFVFANGQLVGEGIVGTDATDGVPGDGNGAWEVTVEPLVDGDYSVTAHIEDIAGNFTQTDPVDITIDTAVPNTPLLDLISDGGISSTDNITNVNTPTVTVTANDTVNGGNNPAPNDIKYRIYGRDGAGEEVLLVDSFANLGDFTTDGFFQHVLPPLADGTHSLKLEVEDRAGNLSPDFLLEITIDTQGPDAIAVDLLTVSDTGMSSTDNVTGIDEPAFGGLGTVGDRVTLYANGEVVGVGQVGSDETDGVAGNGLGAWEITSEPLDDDVYEIVALVEDEAGNFARSEALLVEVDTIAPNTPFLDLREADDTGRHNDDNITNADPLVFSATTHDANADLHARLIPGEQNFKYRVYARPEFGQEVLVYNSVVDASITDLLDGLTANLQQLTTDVSLPEGLHNLKLEVEDRAGNISEDYLFDLLVDRTAPTCNGAIHPDSDTGVAGNPGSFSDGVTNESSPKFTGTAEANAVVSLLIGGIPVGSTVALPFDGDDAFSPPANPAGIVGNWELDAAVALADGVHSIEIVCEDPAGNRGVQDLGTIVIDLQGPRIANITLDDDRSLFDPKPAGGPDPLVRSIVVHYNDGPIRTGGVEYGAVVESIAAEEGNYVVVGDANGNIPISRIEFTSTVDQGVARSQAELFFVESLPDDRFTITLSDSIMDLAGNRLDGESGARAPFEGNDGLISTPPIFPTGDDVPGGDFVARFTIDSRPEIGTWGAGNVWIDTNGNFLFDPENVDFVNRDIVYKLGFTSDDVFSGNFALNAQDATDGYDKLAVYGRHDGRFRWLVDTDNDGVPNIDRIDPNRVNGLPFAGRFDNVDANGDEVGVYDGSTWYFDTDHDFKTDYSLNSSLVGYPIVGDFDGDGFDDLATYADDTFMIDFAGGSRRGWDGKIDQKISFGFIGVRERPVAADMDQDGFDDLGLWTPDREGVTDRDRSEWYFLVSNGESILNRLTPQDDPVNTNQTIDFTPIPFGPDIYARWGDEFARPVVGNFDPPTNDLQVEDVFYNSKNSVDVNNDGFVSPSDALAVINELTSNGSRRLVSKSNSTLFVDVNNDGFVSPADALKVINWLNQQSRRAERSPEPLAAIAADHPLETDAAFAIQTVESPDNARINESERGEIPSFTGTSDKRAEELKATTVELIYDEFSLEDFETNSNDEDDRWFEV